MRLAMPKNTIHNPLTVMRRAGYSAFTDPVTREDSFVLRLSQAYYPRFHVYTHMTAEKLIFDVHLDQKQPSYGDGHMHGGEYDGPTVEREVKRISSWVNAIMREEKARPSKDVTEEHEESAPNASKKWFSWFWN